MSLLIPDSDISNFTTYQSKMRCKPFKRAFFFNFYLYILVTKAGKLNHMFEWSMT